MSRQYITSHRLPNLDMPLFCNFGFLTDRYAYPLEYHRDPGHEITVMLKGEAVWLIDDGPTLNVPGGTLGLTQPNVLHRGRHDVIEPCHLIWLCIDFEARNRQQYLSLTSCEVDRLKSIFTQAGNCTSLGSRYLMQLCRQLIHVPAEEEASAFWLRSLLQQITVETGRLLCEQQDALSSEQNFVQTCEDWLKQYYGKAGLTVGMMADELGYTERSFFRKFDQKAGISPADFILRYRLGRSQKLLIDSNHSITDIALNCGFSSSQNFARTFRKFMNKSPSAFRKRYQDESADD